MLIFILFEMFVCFSSYQFLKLVVNNIYKPRVVLASSIFSNAIKYFILNFFLGDLSSLVERIFEIERSWNLYYLIVAIRQQGLARNL